jgi:hypothetical protein
MCALPYIFNRNEGVQHLIYRYRMQMLTRPLKEQNQLFHSIPLAEWEGLLPYIELVQLPLGKIISEPDTKMAFIYFPVTAIVSILHELSNGTSAEVAVVGCEGLVGISIFMGGRKHIQYCSCN